MWHEKVKRTSLDNERKTSVFLGEPVCVSAVINAAADVAHLGTPHLRCIGYGTVTESGRNHSNKHNRSVTKAANITVAADAAPLRNRSTDRQQNCCTTIPWISYRNVTKPFHGARYKPVMYPLRNPTFSEPLEKRYVIVSQPSRYSFASRVQIVTILDIIKPLRIGTQYKYMRTDVGARALAILLLDAPYVDWMEQPRWLLFKPCVRTRVLDTARSQCCLRTSTA